MNIQKIIDALCEYAKRVHYSEAEGICNSYRGGECDCGADKINSKIDELILELMQESERRTKASD